MNSKLCPNCGETIKFNDFYTAISSFKSTFKCKKCSHALKKDFSYYSGLVTLSFLVIYLPLSVVLGFSRYATSSSSIVIQNIFNVSAENAFFVAFAIILSIFVISFIVLKLIFRRLKFE